MADVKAEYLVKELSARVDDLEVQNSAFKAILIATLSFLPKGQIADIRSVLKESHELSIRGGPASLAASLDKRQIEIEKIVGQLS